MWRQVLSKARDDWNKGDAPAPILQVPQSSDVKGFDTMLRQGRSLSGNERHCVFLNTLASTDSQQRFATVSAVSGLDFPDDGRAVARVDWDHDGDMDLWFSNRNAPRVRLMRNDSPQRNGYLQLRLEGNGRDTNRDAVGARVTVELKPRGSADAQPVRLIKTLRAGEGFLTQSSSLLHFGLGEEMEIVRVVVRWPGAEQADEDVGPLQPNMQYRLVQGSGSAEPVPSDSRQLALKPATLQVPAAEVHQRIPLVHQLVAPQLGYYDFDGKPHDFPADSSQVTLVNLWSSTCRPCLGELEQFALRADELKQAGVRILALSVDELESTPNPHAAARAVAERLNLPFAVGMAPPSVIDELRRRHNILIKMDRPLPLPTSFLIDRRNRLDIIYKGPVEVDTLVADAGDVQLSPQERFLRSAAFAGSLIDNDVITSAMDIENASVHIKLARDLTVRQKLEEAASEYEEVLKLVRDVGTVHNDVALVYLLKGDSITAAEHFDLALQLDPENPDIHINLAQAMMAEGRNDEARDHLEQALALAPEHANGHFNMGVLLTRLNDLAGAEVSFQTALQFDSRHAQAHFSLGKLLQRKGQLDRAKDHYQQALDAMPGEAVILASLGEIHLRQQNLPEAESYLRRAIDQRPDYADAHYQLGVVLLALGRTAEARQQFETSLRLDSGHAQAREALQRMSGAN